MNNLLYQNDVVSFFYEEASDMLTDVWTEKSGDLSENEFKEMILKWFDFAKSFDVSIALTDLTRFTFAMTPDLQTWTTENVTVPLAKNYKYRKHAFIVPEEFFAKVSIDQFAEENDSIAVATKLCENRKEALIFLNES
jgi:hypothetical protein